MQNRAVVDSSLSAFLRWIALLLNAELVSRGEGGALDCLALQQRPATTTINTLTLELGMDNGQGQSPPGADPLCLVLHYCKDHFRWNVSKVGFGVTVAKYLSCFWAQDDISIGGFGSHLFIPENGQALISSWKNPYCVQTWFQKSHDEFWTDESYFLMM